MSDETSVLIHSTYRHIDRPVHICGLTIAKWTQLAAASAVAWALAKVLPFTAAYDAAVAITAAGTPLAITFAAGTATTNPFAVAHTWLRWKARPKLYRPSPPEPATDD